VAVLRRWQLIGDFAATELARPEAQLRANEMLGPNRRKAQFYGLHHAGQIEVRAYHPQTRRLVKVAFGDYSDIDFQTHELICSNPDPWSSYRRAQARFVQLPVTVQRIDLFSEILRQWPSHVRLNVPRAVAKVREVHPSTAQLFELPANRDEDSFARQLRRELEKARKRTAK
jgi:hypothetical protein